MRRLVAMSAVFLALSVCARVAPGQAATPSPIPASYLDYSGHDDVLSGGVKMIPVETYFDGLIQFIRNVDAKKF